MDAGADLWRGVVGTGADVARVEVYDLVAAMAALDELGIRTPFRETAAKLDDEALTSIMSRKAMW